MQLRRLPAEDAAVRRYVEALWLPYHRELESTVDRHALAEDTDLAGFVTTDVDASPSVFDRPDRLFVGDLYVAKAYRGTGLAGDLMDRAADRAREAGCEQLVLDVDVDNDRAVAFYEKLGFEPYRRRLVVDADDLSR